MRYNFDEVIDRRNTDALKVEALGPRWGRTDLLPLWVADMDFRTPPFVMEAIRRRCEHEILGYTSRPASYGEAIGAWLQARYRWAVTDEQIHFVPGIVPAIVFAIQCFTEPGDKVLIQTPVYHPFFLVTRQNGRQPVFNPLKLENGTYRMDTEHLRRAIGGCRLFLLCNPHNPGGRVWTKDELAAVAEICRENGVLVVSDEIHADLTFPEFTHTPFACASEAARMNAITFMSPSKAFNMPGLGSAYSVVENPAIRQRFESYLDGSDLAEGHVFSFLATEAAYRSGAEWLRQAVDYIRKNVDFLESFLSARIPEIGMIRPQASYLVFLDCRRLGLPQNELVDFFVDKAHLALNDGAMFGAEGTGFMRMNVGCSRRVLEQALLRLEGAYNELRGK